MKVKIRRLATEDTEVAEKIPMKFFLCVLRG